MLSSVEQEIKFYYQRPRFSHNETHFSHSPLAGGPLDKKPTLLLAGLFFISAKIRSAPGKPPVSFLLLPEATNTFSPFHTDGLYHTQ